MASIATWRVRVPVGIEFGTDKVNAVLTVKRASVEGRDAFTELRDAAAKNANEFTAYLVPNAVTGKMPKPPSKSEQQRLVDEDAANIRRMREQVVEYVTGVDGVEVETAPRETSTPNDGASLIAACGDADAAIKSIWTVVLKAQFLAPTVGNASAA